jgi:hypothetical protein
MRDTSLYTEGAPSPEPTDTGRYLPIAEHGLIGNLQTVALVGTEGTIDWYCCPRFDAPSLFGALLDRERGGFWRIAPAEKNLDDQTALLPGHQRPHHPVPEPPRRRRSPGLHATRFISPPGHPPGTMRVVCEGLRGLPGRGRATFRLR